jgi:fatty-acid peroxygenase
MSGPAAAALFYDNRRFMRAGAAPEPLQATLFGKGGVQGLDDEAHRLRKALFMDLMTPQGIDSLLALSAQEWQAAAQTWRAQDGIVLYDAVQRLLMRAACAWVGVPLGDAQVEQRTRQMVLLFDAAGDTGPRHFAARRARRDLEDWLAALVEAVRRDPTSDGLSTPLRQVAAHRTGDGMPLAPRVAAVELLNVIRPIVAVAVYVVFIAHALQVQPQVRQRLAEGDEEATEWFVQEVRRFYPFFPATVARVREEFDWNGMHFVAGRRVLLDLYGTNHDERSWQAPDTFMPERFRDREVSAFELVPQGGGAYRSGHRCPGEWITIALMTQATQVLTQTLAYSVPAQDLWLDMQRLPALPRSRMQLAQVRVVGAQRFGDLPLGAGLQRPRLDRVPLGAPAEE